MKRIILSFAVLITGIWAIISSQQGDFNTYKILKPLTTVLVIIIALLSFTEENKIYNKYTIIALFFCLTGDIFLLKSAYFIFGLVAFLIAHLFFTYAFSTINGFSRNFKPLIVLSIICLAYFFYLKPGLGDLTIPVAVYMSVIILMTWQAISLYFKDPQKVYLFIGCGAICFMLSDSLLAYNKFKAPFALADVLILATYWLAVYIFAYSSYFVKNRAVR